MKFAWMYLFQHLDTWSFNVFALNDASGDHALKFVFYELLTRYDLIQRFKVCAKLPLHSYFTTECVITCRMHYSLTKNLYGI